ncbi:hypothetical protein ISN45_Aa06g006850 [Arabidopsis thaliana x Arabidopsis arenosa]|uniref:Uncharacterized protein n=2 Tax=Arabidopsis TaxID=3701 RepID=A0A8T1Z693_ARASU|nr:hypothetical protein ISN45_Aa06g006850 [Arabidopsis thaliana x Arabidopsis arenosa]KAG7554439.1 hypothetical protein ISN44_As11g006780 [Arabidopsis suecica]
MLKLSFSLPLSTGAGEISDQHNLDYCDELTIIDSNRVLDGETCPKRIPWCSTTSSILSNQLQILLMVLRKPGSRSEAMINRRRIRISHVRRVLSSVLRQVSSSLFTWFF